MRPLARSGVTWLAVLLVVAAFFVLRWVTAARWYRCRKRPDPLSRAGGGPAYAGSGAAIAVSADCMITASMNSLS